MENAEASPVSMYASRWGVFGDYVEAIRYRPRMYIGSVGAEGLVCLIEHLLRPALFDSEPGTCTFCEVVLRNDGYITVRHDGVFSVKANQNLMDGVCCWATHRTDLGSVWIEVSAANALSDAFEVNIYDGTNHYQQSFAQGETVGQPTLVPDTSQTGRSFTFHPDPAIFTGSMENLVPGLLELLRVRAAIFPRLRTRLVDEKDAFAVDIHYPHGLADFLADAFPDRGAHTPVLHCTANQGETRVQMALCWMRETPERRLRSFVNDRETRDGSHVDGLLRGLTQALDRYARQKGWFTPGIKRPRRQDLPPGLIAVVSVILPSPRLFGPMRLTLGAPEVGKLLSQTLREQLPAKLDAAQEHLADWAQAIKAKNAAP